MVADAVSELFRDGFGIEKVLVRWTYLKAETSIWMPSQIWNLREKPGAGTSHCLLETATSNEIG
jgi:hypothetical protein